MERSDTLNDLRRAFRDSLYECFDRRADALFELGDAILSAGGPTSSPGHLSLRPPHRRGWGGLYAAIATGRINAETLRMLLPRYPLAGEGPCVYAVEVSVWPGCDAEASPERGFYYHPSRHSAGRPIVAGWAYRWIARLGFARESWVAPMDARGVHPAENVNSAAVRRQVKAPIRRSPEANDVPLFVFDGGYDPVQPQQGLEDHRVSGPGPVAGGQMLLGRPAEGTREEGRPPAPPRRQAGLQGSLDLARAERRAYLRGRALRSCPSPLVERVACQDAEPSRPRDARSASHQARHANPRGGEPPAATYA